ncbi:aminotransferase class V-fold PLP-dependent enzyme [Poseidonocella sp. HB161398]|uniref:aminotransferase class V-fold PLP-dependent enzyme n=1 Tax=Poseidonocella sp. HB161398 TaxID=2320855 RepID=UPI00110819DF|nr:cysteine desulfurase [Poseidonocella sp. HB161398]
MLDVTAVRKDFPILSREVNGHPLAYLDTASSAQKPGAVIDAVTRAYTEEYANVHRGLHTLSAIATERYESVRGVIARFIGASSEEEIVFTGGATEGINLVAHSWAAPRLRLGDEIILSTMEHHANIVPWHFLRERQGAVLKWVPCDAEGWLDPQAVMDAVTPRTRLIAVTHMSNVVGTLTDVAAICRGARERGVPVLVDGAQGAVHAPVDVEEIGCDFYALTGHKLYGPSASGALYIRADRAREMRPWKGGGDMIRDVTLEEVSYAAPPLRFEAGTPAIVPQIGFGAALGYLMDIGMEAIRAHETRLRDHAADRLGRLEGLRIIGGLRGRGPLFAFTLERGPAPAALALALDAAGIAVRSGSFCSRPVNRQFGIEASCRASFGLYTATSEIDRLAEVIAESCEDFRQGRTAIAGGLM